MLALIFVNILLLFLDYQCLNLHIGFLCREVGHFRQKPPLNATTFREECRKFLRNRFLKIIYAKIQNVLC